MIGAGRGRERVNRRLESQPPIVGAQHRIGLVLEEHEPALVAALLLQRHELVVDTPPRLGNLRRCVRDHDAVVHLDHVLSVRLRLAFFGVGHAPRVELAEPVFFVQRLESLPDLVRERVAAVDGVGGVHGA